MDVCNAAKASKAHLKKMADGASEMADVTMIDEGKGRKVNYKTSNKPKKVFERPCKDSGQHQEPRICPSYGRTCHKSSKKHNFDNSSEFPFNCSH